MSSTLVLPRAAAPARLGTARRYLLCPPRHFAVRYSINPWMDPSVPVDVDEAMRQWTALRDTLSGLGNTVELIEPQPGLPDMVFAANAAIVLGGRALGARFRAPQREPEAAHYRTWLAEHGFPDIVLPEAVNEGAGDFVWTGRELLAGTGFRTQPAAHAQASRVLGVPVVSLRLVDPRYYHLDTCLVVLDATPTVAYYPPAFSSRSRRVLARLFPDAVLATAADAACLGLNAVTDGHHVVLPVEAGGLAAQLADRGFEPIGVAVSELRKAGGGPKCCTLELRGR